MEGWGTIKEAANYASVGQNTIRKWMRDGLPYSKPSRKIMRIKYKHLDEYLESFMVEEKRLESIADEILNDLMG